MRLALTAFFTIVVCAYSTVAYAWVDHRRRIDRYRAIVAANALRRRVNTELADLREQVAELAAHLGLQPTPDESEQPATQPLPVVAPQPPTEPIAKVIDRGAAQVIEDEWLTEFRARMDRIQQGEMEA